MGVSLRVKKYKSGTNSYYLDIYNHGNRSFEFLDIKFSKSDSTDARKEKKSLAENIRAKRQLEIENSQHGFVPKHRRKAIFNSYYDSFLNLYSKKDKRIYRYAYEKFKVFYGDRILRADQITPKLMEDYKDYLQSDKSGLNGETPYDYFVRFKRVIKKAFQEGLVSHETYFDISNIIAPKRHNNQLKKQILSIDELRLLKKTECGNSEVKRAFLFSCFTGLGEAEIRKLTWRRILKEGKITIFREKSGEQVINDLPRSAIDLLGKRGEIDNLIFQLPSMESVNKTLKNWIKRTNIEKNISFYCGRHTFAVSLLTNGSNLKTVADCLGHSSTKHTVKYLNYVDELKSKAIASLPSL